MNELQLVTQKKVPTVSRALLIVVLILLIVPLTIHAVKAGDEDNTQSEVKQQTIQVLDPLAHLPAVHEESVTNIKVKNGDNLYHLLGELGINNHTIYQLTRSQHGRQLKRLQINDKISIIKKHNQLTQLIYQPNRAKSAYYFTATDNGFRSFYRQYEFEVFSKIYTFTIRHSLYKDGVAAGLSDNMLRKLSDIFAWDIDFARDVRPGDRFTFVAEELTHEGEQVAYGDILAAEYINYRGKAYRAVLFKEHGSMRARYFSPSGESVQGAFLRNPVDIFRISSHFNPNRKHPVLNTIRSHKGTDYAAARGSKVRATGDGIVHFAGDKNNGYGNYIAIRHGGKLETRYAHLDRIHPKVKKGAKVKQGQTIGYVGKTGLATGYHLHYEFLVRGVAHDPVAVKFPKASPVKQKEFPAFVAQSDKMQTLLDKISVIYLSKQ